MPARRRAQATPARDDEMTRLDLARIKKGGTMRREDGRSPLERFLGLFAEVRKGEGANTVLLALNIFLILTAYYILKPVREALILSEESAEVKSYAAAGQAALLMIAVPAYAVLAGRLPRRRLMNAVILFFVACLGAFFLLGQARVPIGVVFYLWIGIFSLMAIAQFWAFANDLHTPEEGKRLFAIVAFGATAGAVFGSLVLGEVIDDIGVYAPFLLAAATLIASLFLTNVIHRRNLDRAVDIRSGVRSGAELPVARGDAFRLVFKTRYLLLIALLIVVLNWVNTTGEFIQSRIVEESADRAVATGTAGTLDVGEYIGRFYSRFYLIVNIASVLIQLFLVSRIIKYLGVRVALLILPVIAFGGYAIIALYPVLGVVRWAKTAENSTDYSLMNTLRGVLFLPTTREQKYKGKQAIDSFFVRIGDLLSAATVALGLNVIGLGTTGFAAVNLGLTGLWILFALFVGIRFHRATMERDVEATTAEEGGARLEEKPQTEDDPRSGAERRRLTGSGF